MFLDKLVFDVHGHLSSPPQVRAYAYNLISLRSRKSEFELSDDAVRPAMDRHLKLLDQRNVDVQLLSARPIAMMHWEAPFLVELWTKATNDLIAQQCRLAPNRFVGIAQLPQNADLDTSNCVAELERCITELGFVGALLNPDPSGHRDAPGVDKEYWYPLYAKAEELQATLIIHPSITKDVRTQSLPRSFQYSNLIEETLATGLYESNDVFKHFPRLRVVVCHCGGALRRLLDEGNPLDFVQQEHGIENVVRSSGEHAGGQVGMNAKSITSEKVKPKKSLADNLFFDTCAYDPIYLSAAIRQRGVDRMVFGTEAPGAGSELINPETNAPSDDLLTVLKHFDFLTDDDRSRIVHSNVLKAFPLIRVEALAAG